MKVILPVLIFLLFSCGKESSKTKQTENFNNVEISKSTKKCFDDLEKTMSPTNLSDVAQYAYSAQTKCKATEEEVLSYVENLEDIKDE